MTIFQLIYTYALLPMSGMSFKCESLIKKFTMYYNCGFLLPIRGKILLCGTLQ